MTREEDDEEPVPERGNRESIRMLTEGRLDDLALCAFERERERASLLVF